VRISDAGLKRVARGSLKIQDAKKSSKTYHLGTIVDLCRALSLQLRHISTIGKKLVKQQYLLQMSPQYGELGPLAAEIGPVVWGTPTNFNGFRILQHYCSNVAQRKPTKLCTVFVRLLGWYTKYTFWGFLPHYRILQNSLCIIQVLRTHILVALLHGN